jgi:hypothetical protein
MTRRRRLRWWAKWAAAATSLLLSAGWCASGWWTVRWSWDSTRNETAAFIVAGSFVVVSIEDVKRQAEEPWPGTIRFWGAGEVGGKPGPEWWLWFDWKVSRRLVHIVVPLWAFAAPTLLTAAVLFYRDRPIPPSRCLRCHYDLSGSPPGPCPECGHAEAKVEAKVTR